MNNQSFDKNYIDVPSESFNATNSYGLSSETTIKQEVIPISNQVMPGSSRQFLAQSMNSHASNENIEYISNDMDDDNIQGKIHNFFLCHTVILILKMNSF